MSKKEKVNQLIESLEDQELDVSESIRATVSSESCIPISLNCQAPNGLEASLYATLFSAYLYKGDL